MTTTPTRMRAMILAAGRGERMGALTAQCPKPLLRVDDRPLIDFTVTRLAAAGLRDIVVNVAYRGPQIQAYLGDGARFGVSIRYSVEPPGALDTGGGIAAALPYLGPGPFIAVNADVWTDFDFAALKPTTAAAHIVLVPNPDHHPEGDFRLDGDKISEDRGEKWTFAGIGVYAPELFAGTHPARFPLAPLLREAAAGGRVSGELYRGTWVDVGTPARLETVKKIVAMQRTRQS